MRDSGELEQLIEAVKRQPGSRAFAMLAERYLEQERVDEALRVCQAGFAANSSYERGALAYLRVLRKLGDRATAEGVYRRAIGTHPRSSRLRVGWSLILLDEGREREARQLAREALDLDPSDREARALIATLGGTPPPTLAGSTKEYQNPPLRKKDLTATSPPPLPASVRIRPPGQRTSATSLFDLTTAPPGVDETPRPRFNRSPFDATPVPLDPVDQGPPTFEPRPADAQHGPLDIAPREQPRPSRLDQTGERDLFPEGGGSVTVSSVADARITGEHAAATRDGDIALSDTVSLPDAGAAGVRRAAVTTGPPAPIGLESDSPPRPLQSKRTGPRSALDFTLDDGSARIVDEPPPTLAGAPKTTEVDQLRRAAPKKKRRWPLVVALIVVVVGGGGGTAGFLLYKRHARAQAVAKLEQLLASTRPDRRQLYLAVDRQLAKLHAAPAARRAAARALVAAHLLRLGHRNEAQTAAWLRTGARSAEAQLARGLIALVHGDKAPTVADEDKTWHGRLLAIERAVATKAWDDVRARGRAEAARGAKASPAVLLAAAHADDTAKAALALIGAGLAVSPEHPGLRIEKALRSPEPSGGAALIKLAGPVPSYKARALLVAALEARRNAKLDDARAAAKRAAAAPAAEPAALLLVAALALEPGGSLVEAADALRDAIAKQRRVDAGARLSYARVLLRLGRAYAARAALAALSRDKLDAPAKLVHLELSVRSAALLDDTTSVSALCKGKGLRDAPLRACARAMIERALPRRARALIGSVRDPHAKATLLAEHAMARGDAKRALRALARTKAAKGGTPSDTRAMVAARAHSARGEKPRAVAILRAALTRRAPDVHLRLALARVLIEAGHDSEAREQLDRIIAAKPEAPRVIAAVGAAMLGLGAAAQAKRVLAAAPVQARGSTALRLLAGRVALAEGDHARARKALRGVLRDNPRDTAALLALARLAAARKKRRRASAYLARALRIRPGDPALQMEMARVYVALGRFRKALGPGLRAVRLYKQNDQDALSQQALVQLGRMFRRARDKWALARAEELLFEVTKEKNAPAVAFLELGLVHAKQRDRARAILNLRKAVRRDPSNATAVRALAMQLYGRRRTRREAKRWLRRYLKLSPQAKDAKRIQTLLRR